MTCLLFPGLNGLMRIGDRKRFLGIPEVISKIHEAEGHIEKHFSQKVDLFDLLQKPTKELYGIDNIHLVGVIISSIQVGVVDALKNKGVEFDVLLGCSLGDLSRTICAGAYSFENALVNYIKYTVGVGGIDKTGANIGVASPKNGFTEEDYEWFERLNIDVSKLTPKFLNIGGLFEDLEKVRAASKEKRWATMPIVNYPAHSRYIKPYVDKMADQFIDEVNNIYPPKLTMYSSLTYEKVTDPEVIKQQFLDSISSPIYWQKAIEAVLEKEGVNNFINVGPCKSLSVLMKDIDPKIEVTESSNLIF